MANSWQTRVKTSATDNLVKLRQRMPANNPVALHDLASNARSLIITRTEMGIGKGNRPFTPYSRKPYYASIARRPAGYPAPTGGRSTRKKSGKAMKSVFYEGGYGQYKAAIGRSNTPTLSVSGEMLGAIQIATSPGLAILYFGSRTEAAKAHGHDQGTVVPRRQFFDISDYQSAEALKAQLFKHIKTAAARAKIQLRGKAG